MVATKHLVEDMHEFIDKTLDGLQIVIQALDNVPLDMAYEDVEDLYDLVTPANVKKVDGLRDALVEFDTAIHRSSDLIRKVIGKEGMRALKMVNKLK